MAKVKIECDSDEDFVLLAFQEMMLDLAVMTQSNIEPRGRSVVIIDVADPRRVTNLMNFVNGATEYSAERTEIGA